MRILLWHGWLLEGSGSNVGAARVAEVLRSAGHDVALICQEPHPERYPWIDAHGTLGAHGPATLSPNPASTSTGRCVLLRPLIGPMLPVFVLDRYEGFDDVRRFVDLTDEDLETYLSSNVTALRAAAEWHDSEICIVGHAVPGAVIGKRALGPKQYIVKIHGSDIEYAMRAQARYRDLAQEGMVAARAVVGPSTDVLERCAALVPGIEGLMRIVSPGVDVASFRPMPRIAALQATADSLDADPRTERGRRSSLDANVEQALARRDADALDALAAGYDQEVPDPEAASRLRALSDREGPIVGYLGKLIPQKGVELMLSALRSTRHDASGLIVGFGSYREWLAALAIALRRRDTEAIDWLRDIRAMPVEGAVGQGSDDERRDVTFTGRLDHRYAPGALAAMDVLVVPSMLEEAFGMVAAEGAAAGALPLVARHSGLAEVAEALEAEIVRPGLLSFEPGEGAIDRLASGVDRLLSLRSAERRELGRSLSTFVAREWSWERTAARLLEAADPNSV
ncbi:MAG: glycosyltransferase [Actinomycetota bacterium]|nr:glycosyltransferase [Actinomycetota bacterium]